MSRTSLPAPRATRGAIFLSLLLLPLFVTSPLDAQRSHGNGFFALGTIDLDLDALNERLVAADLPAVSSSSLSFGGGGFGSRGRLLIGGEGHGFLAGDETTADGSTGVRLTGGYGLVVLGWELARFDRLTIYPKGGIGGGALDLRVGPREVPRFDDVIENPARSTNMNQGGFLASYGVRGEITLGERVRGGSYRGGPILGVEFSVLHGIGDWRWRSDWGEVTHGPDAAFDGAHLKFTIGGGSRRR